MNQYNGYFIIRSLNKLVRQGEIFQYFPSTYLNNQLNPTNNLIAILPYQEFIIIMKELTWDIK
jgi:hypothetical protein